MAHISDLKGKVNLQSIPQAVLDRWLCNDVPAEHKPPHHRTDELREQWRFLGYVARGINDAHD